jgi:hypothetical protein
MTFCLAAVRPMQWNGQRDGLIVPVTAALEDADAQGIRGTVQFQPQRGG